MSETDFLDRREKAKKRVEELKQFYSHVRAYILVNILLLLLKAEFMQYITGESDYSDPGFQNWFELNILLTPLLWGIGLLIHGLYVYRHKFGFIKNWEERQIRRFMEEEDTEHNKYH
ncbi:MAG: 2TM domain-containing protein [Flavobacteriaceae bacterium]